MIWFKSWAKIEDKAYYLVLRVVHLEDGPDQCREHFCCAQVMNGAEVKEMREGTYIATAFDCPESLAECE